MRSDGRAGIALVAALLAIVCIAALLAGLAFIAREDHVVSTVGRDAQRAFTAAEGAAWAAAAAVDSAHLAASPGTGLVVPVPLFSADTVRAGIVRLGAGTLLVFAEAGVRNRDGHVWRRVGLLADARLDSTGASAVRLLPLRSWVELP